MDKSILILAGAASLFLGALSLDVRPHLQSVDAAKDNTLQASRSAVIERLKHMTVLQFLRTFNDRKELDYVLAETVTLVSENEARLDVRYAGDHVLSIFAKVSPLEAARTAYEIEADFPKSRLTSSDKLLHDDIAHAKVAIALLATEYVRRSFESRPDQGSETAQKLKTALGFSDDEMRAFGDRFNAALGDTYGQEVLQASYQVEKDEQNQYEREHELRRGDAPAAWRAEEAANRALEAATSQN